MLCIAQHSESKCNVSLNWLGINAMSKLCFHDNSQAQDIAQVQKIAWSQDIAQAI